MLGSAIKSYKNTILRGVLSPPEEIYQFRIHLKGISPQIWRRLQVRSDSTLADLHYIIQISLEWTNYHLHQFTIYGKRYAVWRSFGTDAHDAEEIRLQDLKLRVNGRFLYEYSFFEWWQHDIRLEKRLPLDGKKTYPTCTAGARAAPEEGWGGDAGFMRLQDDFSLSHIASTFLEIHERMQTGDRPDEYEQENYLAEIRQFGYWLNIEKFDRKKINQRLKWYAIGDERWADGLEVL
jgi:hypothetical protein